MLSDVVVCREVYRSYETVSGPVEVLRGVDLSIPRRAITALRGPSGSGKSTLLRLIGCVERAESGAVDFDGSDTTTMSRRKRRHLRRRDIGVIHQDPATNLLDYLTIRQHLALGARMRGRPVVAAGHGRTCSTSWASPTAPTTSPKNSPAASSSEPRWRSPPSPGRR